MDNKAGYVLRRGSLVIVESLPRCVLGFSFRSNQYPPQLHPLVQLKSILATKETKMATAGMPNSGFKVVVIKPSGDVTVGLHLVTTCTKLFLSQGSDTVSSYN